jgi:hypothetical protein
MAAELQANLQRGIGLFSHTHLFEYYAPPVASKGDYDDSPTYGNPLVFSV